MITPEAIERNIGISKDYNNFELVGAVARRDMAAMFTILGYFRANPKGNPTVMTTAALYNFFGSADLSLHTIKVAVRQDVCSWTQMAGAAARL